MFFSRNSLLPPKQDHLHILTILISLRSNKALYSSTRVYKLILHKTLQSVFRMLFVVGWFVCFFLSVFISIAFILQK